METMLVRLKSFDPRRGAVLRRYTYAGIKFHEERGWYRVDKPVADYLRAVRQVPGDVVSQLAFDVCTEEEAKALDTREESEAKVRKAAADDVRLSPARGDVICGTAAHFQGDERHIMLSMVDSPEEDPLRLLDQDLSKKRYNVAASRARDQLWVVHSVDAEKDLKPADLRRRLLTHALHPTEWRRRLEGEGRTESEFERRVLHQLVQEGFAVRPQVEVGAYRLDLVVEGIVNSRVARIAIECDGERYHTLASTQTWQGRRAADSTSSGSTQGARRLMTNLQRAVASTETR